MSLQGKKIALAESRQAAELARLFEKEGAKPELYPLVAILDIDDVAPLIEWIHLLAEGSFAFTVFTTGEGVRRLHAAAQRNGVEDRFLQGLANTKIVTRGPKPVQALKELGITPYRIAERPTTEGVIATLGNEQLMETAVGVQHFSEANPALSRFLAERGAAEHAVRPYVYAPDCDSEKVAELVRKMAAGAFDLLVITSSPQIVRMQMVAKEKGLVDELKKGMDRTLVAAVGPIAADTVEKAGFQVAILPEQGFVMKNLVQLVKKTL